MHAGSFCFLATILFSTLTKAQAPAEVPGFKIASEDISIKFSVKSSVPIAGTFDKWDATLAYASTDVEAGVLDVKIQAASVNTVG